METSSVSRLSGYQSDDECNRLRRKKQYSKEDFKEIYCINQKALEGLEKSRSTGFLFLGCLSSYQESPCKRRAYTRSTSTESSSSFFTSCYGAPDRPEGGEQTPRYVYYYHEPLYAQTSSSSRIVDLTRDFDERMERRGEEFRGSSASTAGERARPRSVASNISRENLYNEAKRFTWNEQMERYVELRDWHMEQSKKPVVGGVRSTQISAATITARPQITAAPVAARPPATRYPSAPLSAHHLDHSSSRKHVSFTDSYFTRSATSNSFDEHKIRKARFDLMNGGISQERLIDGRKTPELTPVLNQQQQRALSRSSLIGSRTSLSCLMRTQSTQTETFIVRANGPPPYLSLSPRTSYRSRMISQPTQTNGISVEPITITPTSKKIVELPEQTEEEFHERFLSLLTSPVEQSSDSLPTVISQKSNSKHTSTTSPTDSTSSSGSYSLPQNGSVKSFKVSQLELPFQFDDELIVEEIIKPPEGFGNFDENNKKIKMKIKKKSVRAKSEERNDFKIDAATQSSISLHASLHDLTTLDDDDSGIYMEPYTTGVWIYIGENEELQVWKKHEPLARTSSGESTLSEQEFCKKFIALTHRMVHRKASGETYRRLADNSLEINKRLTLTRSSPLGEFGFRIHGSRPVVVSAVESNSPAESSGLEVGDVIMSINGIHVLESSHSDVVRIAGQVESLECELARTADVCNYLAQVIDEDVLVQGELKKFNGNFQEEREDQRLWVNRFFKLKTDYCLYYYKSKDSLTPLGVLPLTKPQQCEIDTFDVGESHVIKLKSLSPQQQELVVYMSTEDVEEYSSWIQTINTVLNQSVQDDKWIGLSGKFVMSPPSAISNPDCHGNIWKLGRRIKTWQKRMAVIKDACLYFYANETAVTALGATHLHGYRVQTVSILGGKRHAFELVPPINSMRHYYLATDSEHERKRWLAALEYSIDRWINLNSKRSF